MCPYTGIIWIKIDIIPSILNEIVNIAKKIMKVLGMIRGKGFGNALCVAMK